jgi:hypothetical protein
VSEKLFHLIYFSRATEKMGPTGLDDILEVARERNAKCGITGLLLFEGGFFLQILEGPEAEVQALYKSIRKDQRHCEVFTICEYPVGKRHFDKWSMAHYEIQPSDDDLRRRFFEFTGTDRCDGSGVIDWRVAKRFVVVFESLLKAR